MPTSPKFLQNDLKTINKAIADGMSPELIPQELLAFQEAVIKYLDEMWTDNVELAKALDGLLEDAESDEMLFPETATKISAALQIGEQICQMFVALLDPQGVAAEVIDDVTRQRAAVVIKAFAEHKQAAEREIAEITFDGEDEDADDRGDTEDKDTDENEEEQEEAVGSEEGDDGLGELLDADGNEDDEEDSGDGEADANG